MIEVRGRAYGVRVQNFVKVEKVKERERERGRKKRKEEATIVDNVVHRLSV